MKGVFYLHPPETKYCVTWDVNQVLNLVKSSLLIKPEAVQTHPNPPETTRIQPETIRTHPNRTYYCPKK